MRVGDVLGRYCITGVIGHGGMAVVYSGQDLALGHLVAIKVLHPDHVENPSMERRFINEARALVAIRHPGIVELLDVGRTDEGDIYLVMELLEGDSLASRLEQGALPLDQALLYGRQLASALDAAHRQGIVHRDLKPANILLVPDPDSPGALRAKILDFGIAKQIDGFTPAPITATGIIIGTPEYMSPEQCRGEEIDGRSDIYCLGLLLYHMVAGTYPFEWGGETHEILARHLYGKSASPSRLDPTVPAALSRVIDRCMAKLPSGRYAAAAEVEAALLAVDRMLFAHEEMGAVDHDASTQLRIPIYRLSRETQVKRHTLFRWMHEHARDLALALAIGLGAAGSSVLAEQVMTRRMPVTGDLGPEETGRIDRPAAAEEPAPPPVAAPVRPAPMRAKAATRVAEARTVLVAEREPREEVTKRTARSRTRATPPARERRKNEPRRKAPAAAPESSQPPAARSAPAEESYESVETPVVY